MSDSVKVETDDKKPWWQQPEEILNVISGFSPGHVLGRGLGQAAALGRQAEDQRASGLVTETPTQERPQNLWGLPAVGQFFEERRQGMGRMGLNALDFLSSVVTGRKPDVWLGNIAYPEFVNPAEPELLPSPIVPGHPMWEILREEERRKEAEMMGEPASRTLDDILSQYQFDPSPYAFDSTPYDNYMNFLMEQDEETMARINAMYAQLAESAEGNMQRIQDIYGSAQRQSGDVFGGSAQNIEDAYSSASQQAADQMARLGIEAAAPAVLNPMALSQAEAMSGIERAGASSLDALGRYGATAQDFGSQMAQVGQQQGLEVTASIMRDMKRRQAEAAFSREQARAEADREMRQAQAAFNPYARAMERMQAEQMFDSMGQPSIEQQRLMFEMQEAMAKGQLEYQRKKREIIMQLTIPQSQGGRPFMSPQEAEEYVAWLEQLVPGY